MTKQQLIERLQMDALAICGGDQPLIVSAGTSFLWWANFNLHLALAIEFLKYDLKELLLDDYPQPLDDRASWLDREKQDRESGGR